MRRKLGIGTAATALALAAGAAPARALAAPPADVPGLPVAVNARDTVAYVDRPAGEPRTTVVAATGRRATIAGLAATALDDHDHVVGAVITGTGRQQRSRAAHWSRAGGLTLIPLPAGTNRSWAADISNRAVVVINAYSPAGSPADGAYLWRVGAATLTRLAEPAPPAGLVGPRRGRPTAAAAINDAGTVVGATGAGAPPGRTHALRWDSPDSPHLLPDDPAAGAAAVDVNETGTVVGIAAPGAPGTPTHVVVWPGTSPPIDLGPGSATGINRSGVVVGQRPGEPATATAWSARSRLAVRLRGVPPGLGSNATGINDRDVIVGEAAGRPVRFAPPGL